jgi:hypothetical protein
MSSNRQCEREQRPRGTQHRGLAAWVAASNTRRLRLSWVLPLLLVFAQHGAVLHELSHLQRSAHTQTPTFRADIDVLDNGPCLTCEAFAQVLSPAAPEAITLTASPAAFISPADPCYAILTADAPTPRSRGPPQV